MGSVYEGQQVEVDSLDDAEFDAHMQKVLKLGGIEVLASLKDVLTSETANARVSEHLRGEIRRRVYDPQVAETLSPHGHHLGSRRVIVETGYYETFNKDNVSLVDVNTDPIQEITPEGIRTASRLLELDMIIFATGFDSGTGALRQIDIAGVGGATLADAWEEGPITYLGLMKRGFPNLFMLTGPGSPGIRSQVMVSAEQHVEWVGELIRAWSPTAPDRCSRP